MNPVLASGAFQFAIEKSTVEGKITISVLLLVSLYSWTVIFSKAFQLRRALAASRKFFAAFEASRDPLDLFREKKAFKGAPAYAVYEGGVEELNYHLEHHPMVIGGKPYVRQTSFDMIRVAMEGAVGSESMALEKGMIVLSTAVAGGPFIGLLGTVWGVMETFSGIARAASASLTAMAPGVAGALIATVIGLLVAIPAMFAYNFMVTTVRNLTQEMDIFTAELATRLQHQYLYQDDIVVPDPKGAAHRA
jgi:biopolymer transport protein ExbB/TolQ